MHFFSPQIIEEEAAKRIELLVKRRVEEELEKRKDEIELEVSKRVEAAKKQMEKEMMLELEKRREEIREQERKREVGYHKFILVRFVDAAGLLFFQKFYQMVLNLCI